MRPDFIVHRFAQTAASTSRKRGRLPLGGGLSLVDGVPILALIVISCMLAGCGTSPDGIARVTSPPAYETPASAAPSLASATATSTLLGDRLVAIQKRGTLIVAVDPAHPPLAEFDPSAARLVGTGCAPDQLTRSEFRGYEIEVADGIAGYLGLEPCFVTPDVLKIETGGWDDQWDVSLDALAITTEYVQRFQVTQPYLALPVAFYVRQESHIATASDLKGRSVGVCEGCTTETYLRGALVLPGQEIAPPPERVIIRTYPSDSAALTDLVAGRLDAFLAPPLIGMPAPMVASVKPAGKPMFYDYLAPAVERAADAHTLAESISRAIQQMHQDGTLTRLSAQMFQADYSTAAAKLNVVPLNP